VALALPRNDCFIDTHVPVVHFYMLSVAHITFSFYYFSSAWVSELQRVPVCLQLLLLLFLNVLCLECKAFSSLPSLFPYPSPFYFTPPSPPPARNLAIVLQTEYAQHHKTPNNAVSEHSVFMRMVCQSRLGFLVVKRLSSGATSWTVDREKIKSSGSV